MTYHDMPLLNACLNALSTLLLLGGLRAIKNRQIETHYQFMRAAMISSAIFLTSYLTYHTLRQMDSGIGHTIFPTFAPSWLRYTYYAILLPHVVLAVAVLPFVLMTFWRGWKSGKGDNRTFSDRHRKLARKTFPIWLFVAVTGVVVYLLLYQIAPLFKP